MIWVAFISFRGNVEDCKPGSLSGIQDKRYSEDEPGRGSVQVQRDLTGGGAESEDDDGWGSEDSEKYVSGSREFLTLKQRKSVGAEYEPLMNLADEEKSTKKSVKKKEKPKWKPPTGGVQVMMLPPKMHHKKRKKKKASGVKIINAPGIEPMDCTRRALDLAEKKRWRTVSLGSEGGQAYVQHAL